MASLEVDLTKIETGSTITVKWRGKPVFIRRRTEEEIKAAVDTPMSELRDPEPDEARRTNPEVTCVLCLCCANFTALEGGTCIRVSVSNFSAGMDVRWTSFRYADIPSSCC